MERKCGIYTNNLKPWQKITASKVYQWWTENIYTFMNLIISESDVENKLILLFFLRKWGRNVKFIIFSWKRAGKSKADNEINNNKIDCIKFDKKILAIYSWKDWWCFLVNYWFCHEFLSYNLERDLWNIYLQDFNFYFECKNKCGYERSLYI